MISKSKMPARIMGLAAPMALAMGLGIAANVVADEGRLFTNAAGGVLKTSDGECVKSAGSRSMLEACGDVMEKCPGATCLPVDENCNPLDSDGDGVPDCRDKCPGTVSGAKTDADGCEIVGDLTIDLVNDEFDFDSARLKPAMKAALEDVAARVQASKGDESLLVVGHTDSIGTDAYNQGLSERRAQATADYLIEQGVSASRISTKGMGESQPVADNGTRAGRAKNRRVEILTN
jgi:OOP family OmpA-OmpF porin